MVDRIVDFVPSEKPIIKTIKHVTFNDPYLLGHFPTDPVMPGGYGGGNIWSNE
ncbi:fatty acyl chain dehydratase [Proteus mirabilis]|uniref:Fatty acyl chain dehydratase n=1 Tax=Proteus mirabilis TaxID=584 RepID=A0A379GDI7_PROMI|nr:fatty acyl chain dehydratase [Proteus mirabilis]